jgi:hypothetical protein
MTRKKLAIIGAIIVVILVALFLAYHSDNPGNSTNSNPNASSATKTISYNENSLTNSGVTTQQLGNLEQVLGQYLSSQGITSGQVDFSSISRTPPDPANPNPFSELNFMIQVNGNPAYKAKFDSFSTSEIRLYLYSVDDSTLLYDSQNVGGASS